MREMSNQYKKTKFGLIPNDWEIKKLKNIGNSTIGLTYSPKDVVDEEGILVLRSSNIKDGRLSFQDNVYVKKNVPEKLLLKKGDILVCSRNGSRSLIGKNVLITEDTNYTFGAFMSVFRSKYNEYLYQLFQTNMYQKQIQANLGATINQITTKDLNSFQFPFPKSEKEQKKIISILSTWDKAIELKEKLIEQKKEQKKGLMQKLLTGEVRLPGFKEKWEKKKVGDLITESKEVAKNPSLDKRITVRLNLMGVQKREVSAIEKEGATTQYVRRAGQFIYGKQNLHKGALGLVPKELDGYQSSSDIPSFDFKKGVCGLWFYYYFSRESFYTNLERIATGTGSKRIHPNDLFMVKIFVPPFEEQKKISEVLKCMDEEILFYQKELENLKQQKKGLMQLLLTGKVRVKV